MPVVETETVPLEKRDRVTDAVVEPDLETLTVTVPLGDDENVFDDVDIGVGDALTERDVTTDAVLTTVRDPENVADSDEFGDALTSTTDAVGATDFDEDVLVVDDGDGERSPDADDVVVATGAAEHDGLAGTVNKGSVEHATIRIALLFASLMKITSSVPRIRTPVGALNVAAVLTPSRNGVDTPTRPASVSTDLSEYMTRMTWFIVSATTMKPFFDTAMPRGPLKLAHVPKPSLYPAMPLPARVDVRAVEIATVRIM